LGINNGRHLMAPIPGRSRDHPPHLTVTE
jgi:hypothetical protein